MTPRTIPGTDLQVSPLCLGAGVRGQLDEERFLFDLRPGRNPDLRDVLMRDRLERYIGVIYRPETERASHYGAASLAAQYDCFVWFDKTTAVRPLPALANEKEDETYPFGL